LDFDNFRAKVKHAIGKAKQAPNSITKAVRLAERAVRPFPVIKGTIPHEVEGRFGASKVRLIPAAPGTTEGFTVLPTPPKKRRNIFNLKANPKP
jgi:ribosomal protein S5